VVPAGDDLQLGNGLQAGARCPSPAAAAVLADRLRSAGLRVWHPVAGDLHTSTAWPVSTELAPSDLDHYLDIQIPALAPAAQPVFLEAIRTALDDTDLLRRFPGDQDVPA